MRHRNSNARDLATAMGPGGTNEPDCRIPERDRRIPGRLTVYDLEEIRGAHTAGITVEQLAKEYRRKPLTIKNIVKKGGRYS